MNTLRFADWDSDGDMDIRVADSDSVTETKLASTPGLGLVFDSFDRDPEKLSLWLYERRPGDVFEKKK